MIIFLKNTLRFFNIALCLLQKYNCNIYVFVQKTIAVLAVLRIPLELLYLRSKRFYDFCI